MTGRTDRLPTAWPESAHKDVYACFWRFRHAQTRHTHVTRAREKPMTRHNTAPRFLPPLQSGKDEEAREANVSTPAVSTPLPKAPGWAAAIRRITDYLVNDFGGGPRPW